MMMTIIICACGNRPSWPATQTVKLFWNTCDLRGVMTALKLGAFAVACDKPLLSVCGKDNPLCAWLTDASVACDVFECFRSNREFFTLDVCQEAVHVVRCVLCAHVH